MVHGNKKSENSDCNGYIVKFYRITDRDSFDETVNFDFYCWGWFDRIRIIKVSQLDEYQTKSLDRFVEKYKARIGEAYVIHPRNLSKKENGIICIPAYMVYCL